MDTTSTNVETIDRPVQRAVLYARWWQAGPIPPPLPVGNPRVAMYISFGSVAQLVLCRGDVECGAQLDMACAYAANEGWDIVGALTDVGTVDNLWGSSRVSTGHGHHARRASRCPRGEPSGPRRTRRADYRRHRQRAQPGGRMPDGGQQRVRLSASPMSTASRAERSRATGLWAMTIALDQGRLPDDEPRPAFYLLARPHPAGIPPPTDRGPRSTSQE